MADRLIEDGRHQPVLADRVAELLITDPRGAYLDLTAGGWSLAGVGGAS